MALRFRQTFTLFPGVRLNISQSGISTSIGVPGATLNLSSRGVRATVGVPGSGLSYSTNLFPAPSGRSPATSTLKPPYGSPAPLSPPAVAPPLVYLPAEGMRQISSAAVEVLTSESLKPLRDMIAKARSQQTEVETDLKEARSEHAALSSELDRRSRSLFRIFYRRRIAELQQQVPTTQAEIDRLEEWKKQTHIYVKFETSDAAQRAYADLVRAFEQLRSARSKWDVTADRNTNQFRERTNATRTVDRRPARFDFATTDLIRFEGQAMRFENVNGDDILIYPGVAVMPRADGAFALIDLRELDLDASIQNFAEDEAVPPDARVVGHTWAKTNKDGSPDRRFNGNYQIPLCQYGRMAFRSPTGLTEEYQVSSVEAVAAFDSAMKRYQAALSQMDASAPSARNDTPPSSDLLPDRAEDSANAGMEAEKEAASPPPALPPLNAQPGPNALKGVSTPAPHHRARIQWREGSFPMEVVGESNYQDALVAICGRHTRYGSDLELDAVIELEPTNLHDPNAVMVKIEGRRVGYLSREQAARVGGQMREEGLGTASCGAKVRGGWRTNQYDEGHYGVRLAIPGSGWIDFGIGSTRPKSARTSTTAERPVAAATGPLQGHWIALMGTPSDGAIAQELAAAGAKIMAGVGKSTTLLVIAGEEPFDYGTTRSSKYRKAEELIAEGSSLRIVSLAQVRAMIAQG